MLLWLSTNLFPLIINVIKPHIPINWGRLHESHFSFRYDPEKSYQLN